MGEFVRYLKQPAKPVGSRLGSLDVELTERCDNDCIHCCINLPVNDREAQSRELTTAQLQRILTRAAGLGCLRVRFTGGEPLLRRDFEEIYLFARRLGLKVLLFTNARRVTPRLADLFSRIPPLLAVEITVYGMRAETYEAVTRAPGSYAQFRRGVDLLLDRRVPLVVKAPLLPQNKHEMEGFEEWAKTIPWMAGPPGYSMFFEFRSRRDDADKNLRIESLRVPPQEAVAVLARDPKRYREGMEEFAANFMSPPGDALFQCGAGCGLCIDAYGRAQPCLGVRAPQLTVDLFSRSATDCALTDALAFFKGLPALRAANSDYLRRCSVCFLKGFCEQCPAKSWSEHGTLDTPVEYLCEVAHAQARWLGWLGWNERAWASTGRKTGSRGL